MIHLSLAAILISVAAAFVKLEGAMFLAEQSCPLYHSISSVAGKTNPGNVIAAVDRVYKVTGENKENGQYFQVVVPEAPVSTLRWVRKICGSRVTRSAAPTAPGGSWSPVPTKSEKNILALSWQPAFCQTSKKPECALVNDGQLPNVVTGFTLHGLWPNADKQHEDATFAGETCDGDSTGLSVCMCGPPGAPRVKDVLSESVSSDLQAVMPSFELAGASNLAEYEWRKHGTCYGTNPDGYFMDAIALTAGVNRVMGQFMENNLGNDVTRQEFEATFDNAFGYSASKRVQLWCKGGLLTEIRISLSGLVKTTPNTDTVELVRKLVKQASPPQGNGNCGASFTIDDVGL